MGIPLAFYYDVKESRDKSRILLTAKVPFYFTLVQKYQLASADASCSAMVPDGPYHGFVHKSLSNHRNMPHKSLQANTFTEFTHQKDLLKRV